MSKTSLTSLIHFKYRNHIIQPTNNNCMPISFYGQDKIVQIKLNIAFMYSIISQFTLKINVIYIF
jgi:hypothetical protein